MFERGRRGLEENATLLEHMGRHLREQGKNGIADEYFRRARQTKDRAQGLRRAIEQSVDDESGVRGDL